MRSCCSTVKIRHWPYLLDDRDGIIELDFADTSALSDVDAFERRRQNGKNGAKLSKKDRVREREEIERSWDVPGDLSVNVVNARSPQHTALGRPSPGPARTAVPASGSGGFAFPAVGRSQGQQVQCNICSREGARIVPRRRIDNGTS